MGLLRTTAFVGLGIVAVLLSACERQAPPVPTPPSGLVAVIDLDRVARAIGRDEVIAARVQGYADEQSSSLNRLRDDLREQLAQAKAGFGDEPSDEQQQILAQLTARSDLQLQQEITKARQSAEQLKVDLVLDFKQEVQPVARRVAQARGLSVVLIQQNGMLYVDPDSDISDAVIDELQRLEPSTASDDEPKQ